MNMPVSEKIPCTAAILTFNSGATLARTLESMRDFDDVLICDGGSVDDTLSIARAYGARIIAQDPRHKNPDGTLKDYSGARNQCLAAAKYDWFLYIDSDETISPELRDEIKEIVNTPPSGSRGLGDGSRHLAYRVPQVPIMDSAVIRHSSFYPAYQYRFFNRKSGARFDKPVHERIYFDAKKVSVGTLKNPWHTYRSRDEWIHYFSRMRKYRDKEVAAAAEQSFARYLRWSVWGSVRTAVGVLVKALWVYARHGFKETLPVQGELGRIFSPLAVMARLALCQLGWRPRAPGPTRIYYIVNARMPTARAHGIQIAKMCDAFAANGAALTLVVPRRRGARGDLMESYTLSQPTTTVRLPTIDLVGWLPGAFVLETVFFAFFARLWLMGKPAGIVYTRGEMPLLLAPLLPRRFALVWETHIKPQHPRRYARAAKRCNALVAATKAYAEEIPKLWHIAPEKVLYEPDGVSLDDFAGAPSKAEARKTLDLPQDKKIALYAGSDAPSKGVAVFKQAAELLTDNFLAVFVGSVKGSDSSKKRFVGLQPYAQIPLWLAAADVLVLTGDPQSQTAQRYTSPLKLFEYMAALRPVVAVDLPAYRDVLSEENAFLVLPDPRAFAAQIERACLPEGERRALAAKGQVARYDWRERAKRIIAFIRNRI